MLFLSRLYKRRVRFLRFIFILILFTTALIFLTSLRYKYVLSSDVLELIFYQIQGSLSPVDSLAIIMESLDWEIKDLLMFINPFLTMVPRFLWGDKPIEILVPSVFFTKEILNYPNFVTISTGLVGESLLVFGKFWWISPLLVGVLFNILKNSNIRGNLIYDKFLFILLSPIFFGLFRDGLAIFFRDLFLIVIMHYLLRSAMRYKLSK